MLQDYKDVQGFQDCKAQGYSLQVYKRVTDCMAQRKVCTLTVLI